LLLQCVSVCISGKCSCSCCNRICWHVGLVLCSAFVPWCPAALWIAYTDTSARIRSQALYWNQTPDKTRKRFLVEDQAAKLLSKTEVKCLVPSVEQTKCQERQHRTSSQPCDSFQLSLRVAPPHKKPNFSYLLLLVSPGLAIQHDM
jgi:hypothetical protein